MPGLVPGIHVFLACCTKDVDGRDKPGHDDVDNFKPHDAFRCGGVTPSSQSCSFAIASQPASISL
jgi:hypothetical protein